MMILPCERAVAPIIFAGTSIKLDGRGNVNLLNRFDIYLAKNC